MAPANTCMGIFKFDDTYKALFTNVIKPLVEVHTGLAYEDARDYYEAEFPKMDAIVRMIEKAALVIADVTYKDDNPNVFIELGIAYFLKKPLIILCKRKSFYARKGWKGKPPFDIQGRDLLLYEDDLDLKVRLGKKVLDALCRTEVTAVSWAATLSKPAGSGSPRNHVKSSTEIEIFEPGIVWSSEPVHRSFSVNCEVVVKRFPQGDENPDVRLYFAPDRHSFPRILVIFPWETSQKVHTMYECHIDYEPGDGMPAARLQQVAVTKRQTGGSFDYRLFVKFCWPNLVVESDLFEEQKERLYEPLTSFRDCQFPLHMAQYVGFASKNSHVLIKHIEIKEVYF